MKPYFKVLPRKILDFENFLPKMYMTQNELDIMNTVKPDI